MASPWGLRGLCTPSTRGVCTVIGVPLRLLLLLALLLLLLLVLEDVDVRMVVAELPTVPEVVPALMALAVGAWLEELRKPGRKEMWGVGTAQAMSNAACI